MLLPLLLLLLPTNAPFARAQVGAAADGDAVAAAADSAAADAAGLHTAEVGAGGDVAENGEGASSFDAAAFGEGLTLPEIVWGQDDAVLFVTLKQMQCANPSAANGEASHRVLHITTGVVALSCAGRGAVLHLREAIDPSASRCSTSFGGDEACYLTKAQPHAFDRLLRDADDPVRRSRPAAAAAALAGRRCYRCCCCCCCCCCQSCAAQQLVPARNAV